MEEGVKQGRHSYPLLPMKGDQANRTNGEKGICAVALGVGTRSRHVWPLSQSVPGCVTRHTRHASVTHFRPILGNIVEVTLVTPPIMYINSHAKETYFP